MQHIVNMVMSVGLSSKNIHITVFWYLSPKLNTKL